jgi:hypothetical protein
MGDVAIQLRVARAKHFAHSTNPESGEDLVRTEMSAWGQAQGRSI